MEKIMLMYLNMKQSNHEEFKMGVTLIYKCPKCGNIVKIQQNYNMLQQGFDNGNSQVDDIPQIIYCEKCKTKMERDLCIMWD